MVTSCAGSGPTFSEYSRSNFQAKPTSDVGKGTGKKGAEAIQRVFGENPIFIHRHYNVCACTCAALLDACKGEERVGGAVIGCRRATFRKTTNCSCSSSRPGFPFSSVWPGCRLGSMGSLLSSLSSWRPTLGAGTYTVLGDTNGLFERYLTEPGTSSSSVPSLTELPSLIIAQLLPESPSSRGPVGRTPDTPRISPQLPSRKTRSNLVLHENLPASVFDSISQAAGSVPPSCGDAWRRPRHQPQPFLQGFPGFHHLDVV